MGRQTKKRLAVLEEERGRFSIPNKPKILEARDVRWRQRLLPMLFPYSEYFLRDPKGWVVKTKSDNKNTIFKELARYTFHKYKIPKHLETAWTSIRLFDYPWFNDTPLPLWYIYATQGMSLPKTLAKDKLTKREVFYFLSCPLDIDIKEAFWYCIVRAEVDNIGIAGKIAKTKLARTKNPFDPFWQNVARFFSRNQRLSVTDIDDLIDYISHRKENSPDFNLKGRTVESLKEQMENWHRDLSRLRQIGGGAWEGLNIPDSQIIRGKKDNQVIWRMEQITTGNALAQEGNKMRHCVVSYKEKCMKGHCYIWSLTKEENGSVSRALTIEIARGPRVVQCRGLANRLPRPDEISVLAEWCKKYDIGYSPS
jgi:hypothetical protein